MEAISDPMPLISILYVEDDMDTLELLTTILADKFPDVALYSASNGRMGLELFKEHLPDIVITDINMPELNGVQMTDKIRAIKPDAKIIVLTADDGKATMEYAVGKGFEIDHYILKLIDFRVLFAAIKWCLERLPNKSEKNYLRDREYSSPEDVKGLLSQLPNNLV
jgi:DNA-binding response OmpR family regulator